MAAGYERAYYQLLGMAPHQDLTGTWPRNATVEAKMLGGSGQMSGFVGD
jgi:hypothetical protein